MLVIENGVLASRGIVSSLKFAGTIVDTAGTGEEGLELVRHYDYDIVLLDLMLPDMQGYEVVRRMRSGRIDAPVLLLSDPCPSQAKVKGFAAGADEFITRPFDTSELLARVQAVVRRSRGHSQAALVIGPLELNLDKREARVNGAAIHLTAKEYAILELLVMRKGMVLTKDSFLNHLYGGMDEPEMKIIDVFICKLRKKLDTAGARDLIRTVWGRGYTMREPSAAPDTLSRMTARERSLTQA